MHSAATKQQSSKVVEVSCLQFPDLVQPPSLTMTALRQHQSDVCDTFYVE